MAKRSEIFDTHYLDYCRQIAGTDLTAAQEQLAIRVKNNTAIIELINRIYQVSENGITDKGDRKPGYVTAIILFKYLLNCPDKTILDPEWCTFQDFKQESHRTHNSHLHTESIRKITSFFQGRLPDLEMASERLKGTKIKSGLPYDFSCSFKILPRITLLLLVNDADEDFPADCRVLFQKQAEYYLDPESLVMAAGLLAQKLIQHDPQKSEAEK